jgi:HK97 family phage prohead protease
VPAEVIAKLPWTVVEQNDEFCVYKEDTTGQPEGDALGCHSTRSEAEQQVAALYNSEGGKEKLAIAAKEYKATANYTQSIADRTVTGYASVFGNVDSGSDMVHPGSFRKSISEGMKRIRHLWQHASHEPPIAVIKSISEVSRQELPADLLRDYPEATGALLVTREYLDTDRGNEVLTGIKAGAINEMSFGFEVVKKDFAKVGDRMVRHLREIALYESSDVLWGMNAATRAAKSEDASQAWLDIFLDQIVAAKGSLIPLFDVKAGRMISAANMEKLKSALAAIQDIVNAAEPPNIAGIPEVSSLTDMHMTHVRLENALKYLRSTQGYEHVTTSRTT